jgi:hypothetical protein
LNRDPKKCAEEHCDKHVVKMIVETAQILSTVLHHYSTGIFGGNMQLSDMIYKPTHKKHPSVLWAAKSQQNFEWLLTLGFELVLQYCQRYNRSFHKSGLVLHEISRLYEIYKYQIPWPEKTFSAPPQCMPDKYKSVNAVRAYRNYYKGDKVKFAKWTHGLTPKWWN